MAKVPGATTSSSSGSGDRSSTRRSTLKLTTRSLRPAPRSAGISASTIPTDRIRALTGRRRIEPTSPGCRRSRRLEPGRGFTYRAGKTVRIDRASSRGLDAQGVIGDERTGTARNDQRARTTPTHELIAAFQAEAACGTTLGEPDQHIGIGDLVRQERRLVIAIGGASFVALLAFPAPLAPLLGRDQTEARQ